MKKLAALIATFVLLMMPVMHPATAYAAGVDSLTQQEKNSSYGFFVWLSENAAT